MPDKTHQQRRTNRVFKSLHKPLTFLDFDLEQQVGEGTPSRSSFET